LPDDIRHTLFGMQERIEFPHEGAHGT